MSCSKVDRRICQINKKVFKNDLNASISDLLYNFRKYYIILHTNIMRYNLFLLFDHVAKISKYRIKLNVIKYVGVGTWKFLVSAIKRQKALFLGGRHCRCRRRRSVCDAGIFLLLLLLQSIYT